MTKNIESLLKLGEVFKDMNNVLFLRGKLTNPRKRATKENGELYFEFDIKTLKKLDEDEYNQGYNKYHCIISPSDSKNFSESDLVEMKNNEVLVLCNLSGQIEQKPEVTYNKYNTMWVIEIVLSKKIENTKNIKQIINL